MTNHRIMRAGLMTGAACVACCGSAHGQTIEAAPLQDQRAEAAHLGEIVVEARRTRENLQTTPVAVTALTGELLAKLNVRDVVATAQFTPNLSIGAQPASITAASVYIRGIGNASPSAV